MNVEATRRYWNEAIQTLPRDDLRRLQDDRLREAVAIAYEQTGWFRRSFDAVGVGPDDIKSVDDIAALPIFRRSELRKNEADVPPLGDYRAKTFGHAVRLATSSGTSGRPSYALWTRNDLDIELELGARFQWRQGVRPGMVVVNAHPGFLNGGQALVSNIFEHIGCLSISIGPPDTPELAERALDALRGIKVDKWALYGAGLLRLREAAERIGFDGLPEPTIARPEYQQEQISVGQECIGMLGSSCAPGKGCHVGEDHAIVEALDPVTLEPVGDGERGFMVTTSLGKDNPMIRYGLEDVVRIIRAPCDCGETSIRVYWDGRGGDLLRVAEREILPLDAWWHMPANTEWLLVRTADEMNELVVRLEGDPPADLIDRLTAALDVPVRVNVVGVGSLPRATTKTTRVIDER